MDCEMQFRFCFDLWLLATDFLRKEKHFCLQNHNLLPLGIQNASHLEIDIKGTAWL